MGENTVPEQEINMKEERRVKALESGQIGSQPSISIDCSASIVDFLAIVISNTTGGLEKGPFKGSTLLPRTAVPKGRIGASLTGHLSAHCDGDYSCSGDLAGTSA